MDGYPYVVRKECGCIIGAVTSDCPDVGEIVAEWLNEGHLVDRVSDDEVRQKLYLGKCPHDQQQLEMFESK